MIDRNIIENVEGNPLFDVDSLYKMYMDRNDIADNLTRRWKH